MALMTVAEFKEHMETAASDAAIQMIIDAEEAAINRVAGPLLSKVETFYARDYGDELLILSSRASSITSVVEDDETLTADQYALQVDGHVLARIHDEYLTREYWGNEIAVTYVPFDNTVERIRVLIFLTKLGLAQSGYDVERNPEWQMTPLLYQETRVKNLRSLRKAFRFA